MKGKLTLRLLALSLAVGLSWVAIYPQRSYVTTSSVNRQPVNLDLEEGGPGAVPMGWASPTGEAGYAAELTDDGPKTGKRSAVLRSLPTVSSAPGSFGNLMQAVNALQFRGHAIRFRAAVRVEVLAESTSARLWLRADRPGGQAGFFNNMGNRSIRSAQWEYFEIIGQIDADAETLNFGIILLGKGKAWLDDVSLTDLGKVNSIKEAPHPMDKKGLSNVAAFARLLGYLRHFYPGDEAASANWERLAVEGMRKVEGAGNAGTLAESLQNFFTPVAPNLKVFVTSKKPDLSVIFKPPGNYRELAIVSYRHTGFGQERQDAPYKTERPIRKISDLGDTDVLALQRPYVADLGGGVSCVFPLTVFADGKGTLPRGSYRREPDQDALITYSGSDRATRLADVALAWNILQHFYPYFDVVNVNWEGVLKESLRSAAVDMNEKAFLETMRRMIAKLHDGHGRVFYSKDEDTSLLPALFGWIDGQLVVLNVITEKAAGLKPGDVVVRIDGKPASRVIADIGETISAATPQWKVRRAAEQVRAGPKGSVVRLEVRTGSEKVRTILLRRDEESRSLAESRPAKIDELQPSIFYVDLGRIDDTDFAVALPKLATARGVVFDLRGYPSVSPVVISHLIEKPVQSACWMIPIITEPDRKGKIEYNTDGRWDLEPEAPRIGGKIAFLTDGRAISYAESYMGIIEAYHLASIVGETTAGTNGNINPVELPGGYTIVWTGMKVLKHDGTQHHGVGIKPTNPVLRTVPGIANGKDEQLDAALALVGK